VAFSHVIGTVWAATLEEELEKALVYASPRCVNRKYEGQLRGVGDTVRIPMLSSPAVIDYTRNTDLAAPEALNDASTTLVVDQAKAVHFAVDDIDTATSPYDLIAVSSRSAAYKLADAADQHVAGKMAANVAAGNRVGSQSQPTNINTSPTNSSYLTLVQLAGELDEANVPRSGRWVVVSPLFLTRLLIHQNCVFTAAQQSQAALANGLVGPIAGFDVIVSNNVPIQNNVHRIIAGVSDATSFVALIQATEVYRPERRFGQAVKSLYLYGCKVVRPEMLAMAFVNFS